MAASSQMKRQGEGKVGMANESESLAEAALRKSLGNWLCPKCLSEETACARLTDVDTRCSRSKEDA
jgi:hypothetical protein